MMTEKPKVQIKLEEAYRLSDILSLMKIYASGKGVRMKDIHTRLCLTCKDMGAVVQIIGVLGE